MTGVKDNQFESHVIKSFPGSGSSYMQMPVEHCTADQDHFLLHPLQIILAFNAIQSEPLTVSLT